MPDLPRRPPSLRRAVLALSVLTLAGAAARADRVVLVNGRVFDDVVAVVGETRVEIRLGGGSLTLPVEQVASIESGSSTVTEYAAHAASLRDDPATGAASWLELARWAASRDYAYGLRDAALTAAELDPGLAGLPSLLRRLGYELDAEASRWLPRDEAMRRRGWVEQDGEWVPPAFAEARARERQAASDDRRRAAEAARLDRLAALTEMRLAADLARSEPRMLVGPYGSPWGVPIFVPVLPPPAVTPPEPPPPPPPVVEPPRPRTQVSTAPSVPLLRRQPGSLFPVSDER